MRYTRFFALLFIPLLALLLVYCSKDEAAFDPFNYPNLAQDVAYVGMQQCISCHANVHQSFSRTGMGRSFDRVSHQKSAATYGSHALVYDTLSDFYYHPFFKDSSLYMMEFRLQKGDTVHKRLEQIDYIIGSGQHTNSHIIDINGYLFQAPVTYYTQQKQWDMAPGYKGDNLRFSRILTTQCISCHNHYPAVVQGSVNKYADMPRGIECERCHGPGALHVAEKMAGKLVDTSRFIDYTIVNPRDMPRDRQMDICQRCHLQGLAVLEEGKTFFDFKPGMLLSEVMNVYLPRYTNSHEQFIMASQADRLRLSPCFRESEQMSCLSCHHPHHSVEETPVQRYKRACLSCHQSAESCSVDQLARQQEKDNCVSCHMPRSGSIDIPHVHITDHYISKEVALQQRLPKEEQQEIARFLGLQILTKEKASALEKAAAYIALFDKYVNSPVMLDSANYYLSRVRSPSLRLFKTSIHYLFARKDWAAIIRKAERQAIGKLDDAWTLYRIGEAFYNEGNAEKATLYYQKASDKQPFNLDFQEKLASSLIQTRQLDRAVKVLDFILEENPKRPLALTNRGFVQALEGDYQSAESYYNLAIDLDPDYEQALVNKAAIRLLNNDRNTALKLLRRVLGINPDNRQAKAALLQIEPVN